MATTPPVSLQPWTAWKTLGVYRNDRHPVGLIEQSGNRNVATDTEPVEIRIDVSQWRSPMDHCRYSMAEIDDDVHEVRPENLESGHA